MSTERPTSRVCSPSVTAPPGTTPGLGYHYQIEHWTSAKERGAVVAARHPRRRDACPPAGAPYVWSDLYGKKLAARRLPRPGRPSRQPSSTRSKPARLAEGSFTAVYRRGGEPVAVLALDQSRQFAAIRRRLVNPVPAAVEGEPA